MSDNTVPDQTTYTESKKRSYLKNKEKIAEKEKTKKRWLEYYAEHKEEISKRRKLNRLKTDLPPLDEDKIKRYNELMEEAKTLKSVITKKKMRDAALRKREAKKTPADSPGDGLKPVLVNIIEDRNVSPGIPGK